MFQKEDCGMSQDWASGTRNGKGGGGEKSDVIPMPAADVLRGPSGPEPMGGLGLELENLGT